MKLKREPFEMIASGKKIYELRLFDEKRSLVSVGDTIRFTMAEDAAKTLSVKVAALHRFPSFEVLYDTLPLLLCGYREDELVSASYRDMEAYYSREEQDCYGVVAIEISLL
jgi:ASC-1-like (ASCH) protein